MLEEKNYNDFENRKKITDVLNRIRPSAGNKDEK